MARRFFVGKRNPPRHIRIMTTTQTTTTETNMTTTNAPLTLKDIRFGIEVELVGNRYAVARAVAARIGGTVVGGNRVEMADGRRWAMVFDGSVSGNGGESCEIVSPILTYADVPVLQEVVRAARSAGARANSSCGIHVHVDAGQLGPKGVRNLVKNIAKYEDLILFAIGSEQRADGDGNGRSWCKRINKSFVSRLNGRGGRTFDTLKRAWFAALAPDYSDRSTTAGRTTHHYDSSRYHGLNLHSTWYRQAQGQSGTVEFRWFKSTDHAGLIRAYLSLCIALAAKAANAKGASSKTLDFDGDTNSKFYMRFMLKSLGLNGEEFKNVRSHLLRNCKGDGWKKPVTPAVEAVAAAGGAA